MISATIKRAAFDLSDEEWGFTQNIFLDSLVLKHYDESIRPEVKRFADTAPASDWARMEAPDFIGINVYNGVGVDCDGKPAWRYPGFPLTGAKWPVTPEIMHYGPLNLYRRYGLPMYITENGLSCNDRVYLDGKVHDGERIDFLHRYLAELSKAVAEGAPVKGYFQWSLLDNLEWFSGYDERFGMVYVDYRTMERIPKDSAFWYAEVARTNGDSLNR